MKGSQLLPASWDPRLPRGTGLRSYGRHFHPLPQLDPTRSRRHPRSYRAVSLRSAHYQPASAKPPWERRRSAKSSLDSWPTELQDTVSAMFSHWVPRHLLLTCRRGTRREVPDSTSLWVRIRLDPLSPSFPFIGDSIWNFVNWRLSLSRNQFFFISIDLSICLLVPIPLISTLSFPFFC